MKYFTIEELTHSDTAERQHIDNTAPEKVVEALTGLVDNILDPLREAYGRPIYVNSGYRSPSLNRLVGGVTSSSHLTGRAADITTGNVVDNRRLYQLAQALKLPYFELIGNKYNFKWLHISWNPARPQRMPS